MLYIYTSNSRQIWTTLLCKCQIYHYFLESMKLLVQLNYSSPWVTNCPKQMELLRKGPYHVQLSYLHLFLPFIQKKKLPTPFTIWTSWPNHMILIPSQLKFPLRKCVKFNLCSFYSMKYRGGCKQVNQGNGLWKPQLCIL